MRCSCRLVPVFLVLVLVSRPPLVGQEPSPTEALSPGDLPWTADVPLMAEEIRDLMQDRDYTGAIAAIDRAAEADDAPRDYLAYLKGRALFLSEQLDDAAAAFESLAEQFPQSLWARRARFAKAVALARKGDFRGAELVYRAEAEFLLGADRKEQLADVYLAFADAYFDPPDEDQEPDYEKALEFYQRALEVSPGGEKRIELEFLVARCHQELGNTEDAAELYEQFIEDHPESPQDVEARYRLGECLLDDDLLKEARRTWQDLLAKHVDSPSERIVEASFHLSRTWRIPKPASDEELNLGVGALEAFIERYPTHKLAGQAHMEIATSYIHRGRYDDAATVLARFLADPRYDDREEIPDARRFLGRSYQVAGKFGEALEVWREYLVKHPTHQAWSSVQRRVVDTEYLMGLEEFKAERHDDALKLWSEFLARHPAGSRSPLPPASMPTVQAPAALDSRSPA